MGLGMGFSSSSYDQPFQGSMVCPGNPDPSNYNVVDALEKGKYSILKVNYPNCKNYEGNKIMVYECSLKDLFDQDTLDPHFSGNKDFHSPIARFEPTKRGWEMAKSLVNNLNNG